MGKRAGSSFTCCLWPSTGKESALDGAEQAAPPGVVRVDAGAPWRSEEAALGVLFSQDTQDTQIQWSLSSWFHPAPQTVFSIWFPVVSRESRGVFLVVLAIWCYLSPTIRTPGSVGVSHVSELSRHMSFSQSWRVYSITINHVQAFS